MAPNARSQSPRGRLGIHFPDLFGVASEELSSSRLDSQGPVATGILCRRALAFADSSKIYILAVDCDFQFHEDWEAVGWNVIEGTISNHFEERVASAKVLDV